MSRFILLLIVVFLLAFKPAKHASEIAKQRMFCYACEEGGLSTSQSYIVVKVKNLKSGEVKEICTTPKMLSLAIGIETGQLIFGLDCKKHSARYFELKKDSALSGIRFSQYSLSNLRAFRKRLNVDSIFQQIKAGELYSVNFDDEEKYFAHIMFELGVVTTRGCFGTSVHYYNSISR